AYQVAAQLGGPAGEALRIAARHSFVHGLHVTLLVSAALLLLGAVAALRLPRVMDCGAPPRDDMAGAGVPAARAGAGTDGPVSRRAPRGGGSGRAPALRRNLGAERN
ncbi:MFS transporter, partial [Streptomyces niveus]